MSELKVIDDLYERKIRNGSDPYKIKLVDVRFPPVYLKSEADKVIAELKRMDTEHTLQIAKMNGHIHHLEDELRHSNHKRCLAMAGKCRLRARWFCNTAFYEKEQRALKWHRRWLKFADEFKEAK